MAAPLLTLLGLLVAGMMVSQAEASAAADATRERWQLSQREAEVFDPVADAAAVVLAGQHARFTVLTGRMIRMEWVPGSSGDGQGFQDAATLAVLNRKLSPVPGFTAEEDAETGVLTLQTDDGLTLTYDVSQGDVQGFTQDTLSVSLTLPDGEEKTWTPVPGTEQELGGSLLGTIRTLDGNAGQDPLDCLNYPDSYSLHCETGLVSRDGFAVLDDSSKAWLREDDLWGSWVVNTTVDYPLGDDPVCTDIALEARMDCGTPGITQLECENKACCWADSSTEADNAAEGRLTSGQPQCYYSTASPRDLYFFGYGHDYATALSDYTRVAGQIPMPPRFMFGIFFSRYWAYSDQEEFQIVSDYADRDIPIDNMVVDMDWHRTFYECLWFPDCQDQAGETPGWTGFTWDSHLFSDPAQFAADLQSLGLHSMLNIHPASGIQPWEDTYKQMADLMNIQPPNYVPWVSTDYEFTTNFFQVTMDGLDDTFQVPWLDWQQDEDWIESPEHDNLPNLNPTLWANHIFFTNPLRWSKSLYNGGAAQLLPDRPAILHRFGGMGSHRYQIGFSGDVVPNWDSLKLQPYFSSRAANVLFPYWSHDLGGHTQPSPPELYTRWVQFGVFSGAVRTHCTKDADNDRRIWKYPDTNFAIMRAFMQLRRDLIPYIYTQARQTHDTGLGFMHNLYFEYPEDDQAYTYQTEYYFGQDLLVSPAVDPVDENETNMTAVGVWIPSGAPMVDFFGGQFVQGPVELTRQVKLNEMPLYARAGAAIPMNGDKQILGSARTLPKNLVLHVTQPLLSSAGNPIVTELYEDDGVSVGYLNDEYTKNSMSVEALDENTVSVVLSATEGPGFDGAMATRDVTVELTNVVPAAQVFVNGVALGQSAAERAAEAKVRNLLAKYGGPQQPIQKREQPSYTYEGSSATVRVVVPNVDTSVGVNVTVVLVASMENSVLQDGFVRKAQRLRDVKAALDDQWGTEYEVHQVHYPTLVTASEVAARITYDPSAALKELAEFDASLDAAIAEMQALALPEDTMNVLTAWLTQF